MPVNAALLLFFDRRAHGWEKWSFLVMGMVGIFSLASHPNARSLLAVCNVIALVRLLEGMAGRPSTGDIRGGGVTAGGSSGKRGTRHRGRRHL